MFFDDIDSSKLESYVGTTKTFYGRSTKLIEDTMLSMVSVQVITFDLSKISKETAEVLRSQMIKKLEEGETFWFLKSKFGHTSALFESSPEITQAVVSKYSIEESQFEKGKYYTWEIVGSKEQIGILIVSTVPHQVPGFFTISYLNLN
jgi:hypothetical protein